MLKKKNSRKYNFSKLLSMECHKSLIEILDPFPPINFSVSNLYDYDIINSKNEFQLGMYKIHYQQDVC